MKCIQNVHQNPNVVIWNSMFVFVFFNLEFYLLPPECDKRTTHTSFYKQEVAPDFGCTLDILQFFCAKKMI